MGEGGLPGPRSTDTSFAQLRLFQLFTALREQHEVRLVDASSDDVRGAIEEIRPAAILTAGVFGPTRAGLLAVRDEPLCIDLPGDPFADAQMVASFGAAMEVAAEARAVFVPALLRADAFTTISGPSRHALLGQLGLLGRLARTPPGEEWAYVTPVAWEFPGLPEQEPRIGAPLRVALVGGFNTWFDGETLLEALLLAMDRAPFHVECVGGQLPGHHLATWSVFAATARTSRHAGRFHFHDRLEPARLSAVLQRCTVGVVLDRPGYEPELGSRTRLLLYLHQGLDVVATVRCELARELAAEGWIRSVQQGDVAGVAAAILQPSCPKDRAPLRDRYSVRATTEGVRAWAAAPGRRSISGDADALLAATRERDALRTELSELRGSPTFRALDRLRRVTTRGR